MLRTYALVSGLNLAFCVPYLVYTHSLTGKIFYWSTSGGLSLYWMASPHKSDHRFLLPVLPIVLMWLCFVITHLVKIDIAPTGGSRET